MFAQKWTIILKLLVVLLSTSTADEVIRPLPKADKQDNVFIPQVPRTPNCGSSFPGTPQWNFCFENFQKDMNLFQYRMQEFSQQLIDQNLAKSRNGMSSNMFGGIGTNSMMTNGWSIQTNGLPISTSSQNGEIRIILPIQKLEHIDSKFEEREMELRVGSDQSKFAKIRFPEQVKLKDVKYQRTEDNVVITGPIPNSASKSSVQQNSQFFTSPNGFIMTSSMTQGRPIPHMWFF